MNSEKAGSIRCVGPACCVSAEGMGESYAKVVRKLRESEHGGGEAPHELPAGARIGTGRGSLFSSLITKESVH